MIDLKGFRELYCDIRMTESAYGSFIRACTLHFMEIEKRKESQEKG